MISHILCRSLAINFLVHHICIMFPHIQGVALDEVSQTSLEVAKLAVEDAVARARGEVCCL